jgi:hypothetical protein
VWEGDEERKKEEGKGLGVCEGDGGREKEGKEREGVMSRKGRREKKEKEIGKVRGRKSGTRVTLWVVGGRWGYLLLANSVVTCGKVRLHFLFKCLDFQKFH